MSTPADARRKQRDADDKAQSIEAKKEKLRLLKIKNAQNQQAQVAEKPEKKSGLDSILDTVGGLLGPQTKEPIDSTSNGNSNGNSNSNSPSVPAKSSTPVVPAKEERTNNASTTPVSKRKANLSISTNVISIDIPPKETPTYNKETQTTESMASGSDEVSEPVRSTPSKARLNTSKMHTAPIVAAPEPVEAPESSADKIEEAPQKELAPEEKAQIMGSEPFKVFVDRSSRIIERALHANKSLDIMQDYSETGEDKSQVAAREALLKTTLFDERWSKHRSVTDLSWSTKHPELILASYSTNERSNSNDPDGVVLVWNANVDLQKPEFVFNTQSAVMTASFSKFHNTLILGGSYSGQIVLWDTRVKSMPVQRTPLSAIGHTHPVYSMSIVGTANAHNLVSVSTDGKLCVWDLENMSQPVETLELMNKPKSSTAVPVAATALAFPDGEVNQFFVGAEEGALYQAYLHGTGAISSTKGVMERFDGHFGPVTAVDFHPSRGNIDFSHLFLSSSTDWTCRLWNSKSGTKPVYSFEDSTDYVYDVRWSPTHPAVFACADGVGNLSIWDLNEDTEVPIVKAQPSKRAINRFMWSSDGKRIVAGDAAGSLFIYDVGEVAVPDANEWNRFEETMSQLSSMSKATNQEEESAAQQNSEL